ncbi:MAG: hypothetical protein ACKOUM_00235 [Sphingopyxis sp.]
MNPNIDDRLASVIRALSDIILPSLPVDAGLAVEQAQLCIGQLQIIHSQINQTPDFERDEADDARALALALVDGAAGGARSMAAVAALDRAVDGGGPPRHARHAINTAIDALVQAMAQDGDPAWRQSATQSLIRMEGERAMKDRRWFQPMGFDTL